MLYCPYCGTNTKQDEKFCVKCGKNLPKDFNERIKPKGKFNRYWYLPLLISLCFILAYPPYFFTLHHKESTAKELYEQGEQSLLNGQYQEAQSFFENALTYKMNFYEAETALGFIKKITKIEKQLQNIQSIIEDGEFNQALAIVNDSENMLKNYHGTAITPMINRISSLRDQINVEQLKQQLGDKPDIHTLKILLWEAIAINNDEAEEISANIRNEIIDYTFSKASEQLNYNQFNDAGMIVDDGLKYVPDSVKLQSLKTTIEKEKTAFETAQQQRIEQAVNLATKEQEKNKSGAVKLDAVNIENDENGNWHVSGKVVSVATVPISSILIDYTLVTKTGEEILTNKVFSFPDKLYTNETGKFEFTHYEIDKKYKDIDIQVNKMTWYTN